jgi:hypothetical protein
MKKLLCVLALSLPGIVHAAQDKPVVVVAGRQTTIPTTDTVLFNPSLTTNAPLNIPQGTAPASPNNGDLWTTSTGLYAQINGATVGPLTGGAVTLADGADTALGYTTDCATPYNGSGSASVISAICGVYNAVASLVSASGTTQPIYGQAYAATNDAGTIGTGNTFQTFLASNSSRHGCFIQNTSSHTLYVFVNDGVATKNTANSIQVAASGGTWTCSVGATVITDEIDITTSTTSDTFAGYDY